MDSCPSLMALRKFVTAGSEALIGFASLILRPELIPSSGAFRAWQLQLRPLFSSSSPLSMLPARCAPNEEVSHDQSGFNAQQTGCTERRDRVSVDNQTPLARRR